MRSTDKLLVNMSNPFMCEECICMIKVGDIYLEREYKMPSGDIIYSQYCKNCLPSKMYEIFESDKCKPTEKQISYIKVFVMY